MLFDVDALLFWHQPPLMCCNYHYPATCYAAHTLLRLLLLLLPCPAGVLGRVLLP
jgi:hypothetical protein